jgi:hypothetical protein
MDTANLRAPAAGPGRSLLWLGCVLLLVQLALPRLSQLGERAESVFSGAAVSGQPVPTFALGEGASDSPLAGTRGGVYADEPARGQLWGTRIESDAYVGTLTSSAFELTHDFLYVPITGYPHAAGNALTLEALGRAGEAPTTLATFEGDNPREQVELWKLDVSTWRGRSVRLRLMDGQTQATGWLGVGAPIVSSRDSNATIVPLLRPTSYALFFFATLTVLVLLVLPGYALQVLWPRSLWAAPELLPVPGLLSLASLGLVLWCTHAATNPWWGRGYVTLHVLLGAFLLLRGRSSPVASSSSEQRVPLALWLLTATSAFASGLNPMPVEQEFFAGTTLPGRMVAAPPDHATPFQTAVYFFHGKDGEKDRGVYFGEWATTSRGPLVALASTSLLSIFHETPTDPPAFLASRWPVASDGAYLARILGWLCNAAVVLGASRLLQSLGVSPLARRSALVWLALSPLVLIHTVFLWPKLLAVTFLLLAVAFLVEGRTLGASAWMALAWLSHPVGALYLPVIGLFVGHLTWLRASEPAPASRLLRGRAALLAMARFTAMVLLLMSPWLAFKLHLKQPDALLKYPLGHGQGYEPAPDLLSWATTRWRNVWYSLAPLGFMQSELMSSWVAGPLTQPLRFTVQYAKTLPGQLGFSLLLPAYAALFGTRAEASALRLLRGHLISGAFVLMVLYWGYSYDGLGRNSLEPLTALVIVYVVARRPASRGLPVLGLLGLWLEGRYIELSGFMLTSSFRWTAVTPAIWGSVVVSALAGLAALTLVRPTRYSAA